jgi:hypothetical protein
MGKHKYIETPEKMWEYFMAYKEQVKSHPILKHDFVGGAGKEIQRKLEKPLTMEGFNNYLFMNGICDHAKNYFGNVDNKYNDYLSICSHIREIIRQDQIEGGMAGIYNPSITQRLNNLVEKNETKVHVEQPFFGDD